MSIWIIIGLIAIVAVGIFLLFWVSAVVDEISKKDDGDHYSLYLDEEDLP